MFRLAGIQVYLHWSWFLVAYYEINLRSKKYDSITWNILEYLGLFAIVLMHEFGHSLACRQVGGKADQIVLWPLGGVAYVAPPQRPGATLWSIAAGPLVNVILAPILTALYFYGGHADWAVTFPNAYVLLESIWYINLGLLIFNMLPIYPLDGGQILRSLLWFVIGRAKSLMVASIFGFFGVAGLLALAFFNGSPWMAVLSLFVAFNCWRGFQQARLLSKVAKLPRREGFSCPSCHASPVLGNYWVCGQCRQPFDPFANMAQCSNCGAQYSSTQCLDCGESRPIEEWMGRSAAPPPMPGEAGIRT